MLHKLTNLEKTQYYPANIACSFHTGAEEHNFNVLLKTRSCYGVPTSFEVLRL